MSSVTLLFIFVSVLALVFLLLNFILAPHNPYQEKYSIFECGFHSFHQSRSPFNISFFIYGLIYLLFDLELLLLFPYGMSIYSNEVYGLIITLIFILIITAGFVFELGKDALKIDSRQNQIQQISALYVHSMETNSNRSYPSKFNQVRLYSTKSAPADGEVIPVMVYSNADTCKTIILSDNKGKSGIYRWVNLTNGKSYIGSAVNLKERFVNYFNVNHLMVNDSMLICRSLVKYGYSNFRLEILEYCDSEIRFDRENYYIGLCSPEYNILKEANSMPSRLGTTRSESAKLKTGLNNPNRIIVSVTDILTNEETIYDSINKAEAGLDVARGQISKYFSNDQEKPLKKRYIIKKITLSEDINLKAEEELVESWRSGVGIEVVDLITNDTTTFVSMREAARVLNIAHSTIHKYMKSSTPYQDKYLFKKKD